MTQPQLLSALARIPLEQVVPGPNARGDIGSVTDLALSIRALGMQKPLLVSDLGDGRYQILDGHRRYAAAQLLDLPHVDAVLRRDAGAAARIQQQLAMHTHAKAFDPIAEAKALSELMFEHKLTREQIAEAIGRTPGWVRDRISLLQLQPDEQQSVSAGRMTVTEAKGTIGVRRAMAEGRDVRPLAVSQPATPSRLQKAHCRTCRCGVEA